MAKKRRLFGVMLVPLLLGGVAVGVVLFLGPDKARQTWQSLAGRFKSLAARPVDDAKRAPDAVSTPVQPQIDPVPTKVAGSNPVTPVAPATAAKEPATGTSVVTKSIKKPSVTIAQAPAKTSPPNKASGATDVAASPAIDEGDLLAQRLAPPVRVSLPPTPYVREPRGRPATDDLVPQLARIPPALSLPAPVIVGAERRPAQRGQAALDRPPLPADLDPARPERRTWPAEAPAYSASPSATAVPALRYVGLPPADTVTPQEDATGEASRVTMLAGTSIPAPSPPPFLKLTIPDPFEVARVVQLANPPAEQDPPQPSFQRPPPPRLPDEAKKK